MVCHIIDWTWMPMNRILTPRELLVGGGSLSALRALLANLNVRNPLLVIDPTILRIGLARPALQALSEAGVRFDVFSDVVEDPTDSSVVAAVGRIKEGQHDAVIGFGGGSAIDTAKAAALVASTGETLESLKVPRIVDVAIMPVIAIPTTAGTGSEATRACVITNTRRQEKMLILGTACLPTAAIVDYELTLTCPFRVTADTGLDALTHALESLVNRNANPHADALAISALGLIGRNLETACFNPQDHASREAMLMGALHAGLAVSNTSTALVHGMSRPIGAFFHVPHGLSNAMLLPIVTEFSAATAPHRYAVAARAVGWATADNDDRTAAQLLVDGFWSLNERLSVPSLAGFGIAPDRFHELIPEMADQALVSGTPANNLRLATKAEIMGLYETTWANARFKGTEMSRLSASQSSARSA
jgi:alcohol dehydrogenase class IV